MMATEGLGRDDMDAIMERDSVETEMMAMVMGSVLVLVLGR